MLQSTSRRGKSVWTFWNRGESKYYRCYSKDNSLRKVIKFFDMYNNSYWARIIITKAFSDMTPNDPNILMKYGNHDNIESFLLKIWYNGESIIFN